MIGSIRPEAEVRNRQQAVINTSALRCNLPENSERKQSLYTALIMFGEYVIAAKVLRLALLRL